MLPAPIATPYPLPFRAAVQSPPLLASGGAAVLQVVPVAPPDAAAAVDYASVVTAFALLASTGALAGTVGPPAAAGGFEWSEMRLSSGTLEWDFSGCVFDERAAVILAQMFLLSHPAHPIRTLTLAAPGRSTTPLPHDPRLADPYPPVWKPVPFPAAIDPDIYDSAALSVQFARGPTPHEQGEIDGQILTWAVAMAMGAYGIAPVPPNECSAQFEPAVTFLDDELEFDLVRLRAHRASLYGLVNACISLHQTVLPIIQLRIT